MAATIINATTTGITTTAGDESILRIQHAGVTQIELTGPFASFNAIFLENSTTIEQDYELTSGKNAISAGPISIQEGTTVTVSEGAEWTIV